MKKRILSLVFAAAVTITSAVSVSAAATDTELDVTRSYVRAATENGETKALANTSSGANAMKVHGNYVFMGFNDSASLTDTGYYTTVYDKVSGKKITLETSAYVQNGSTASNMKVIDNAEIDICPRVYHVDGNYLYVGYTQTISGNLNGSDRKGGMRVYDISNINNAFDDDSSNDSGAIVDITNKIQYMSNETVTYDGFPNNSRGGIFNMYTFERDGVPYLMTFGRFACAIYNVSDKSDIKCVYNSDEKNTKYREFAYTAAGAYIHNVIAEGNLIYVTGSQKITVFDISDLSNVVMNTAVLPTSDATTADYSGTAKGRFYRAGDYFVRQVGAVAKLYTISVSNGATVMTWVKDVETPFNGNSLRSVYNNGDYLYLGSGQSTNSFITIYDISDIAEGTVEQISSTLLPSTKTEADGTTGASTGGCYPSAVSAYGNEIVFQMANVGLCVMNIGNELIVPEENGVVYKSGSSAVTSITNGEITVETTVTNASFEDKEPYIMIGLYNKNTYEMEILKYEKTALGAGEATVNTQTITVPKAEDYTVETFVFYDLDTARAAKMPSGLRILK